MTRNSNNVLEGIELPKEKCDDVNCPYHGNIKVRGRVFLGTITGSPHQKTVKVRWEWQRFIPKYERYEKKLSYVHVHVPSCIHVNEGDVVKIGETRPLSKTKHFVVLGKVPVKASASVQKKAPVDTQQPKKTDVVKDDQEKPENSDDKNQKDNEQ